MASAEFAPRAVYLPAADALVVADVHLGRVEASQVELPVGEARDIDARLGDLLDRFSPAEVVVAGDLLHAFDYVPRTVERSLDAFRERVGAAGADLVVTPGNHDSQLSAVYDGPAQAAYRLADGETVVCHGHEEPEADAARYLVGHDHPVIDIEGRTRPCFLYGRGVYRGSDVLQLPAFTRVAAGATVNGMSGADFQSPLVVSSDPFRPVVRDADGGETLWFPPLGEFRSML